MSGSEGGMVDVGTLSKLLMVTPAWIGRLVRDGYIPKSSRGKYPLVGAVQGFIRHHKDPDRRRPEIEAASRKSDARTREIELRIAEREDRLLPRANAEASMALVVETVDAVFSTLPARATRDPATRKAVETIVHDCLREVAVTHEAARSALATGRFDFIAEGAAS